MRIDTNQLKRKAEEYLRKLCSVTPNRRTGSEGNRAAVEYFARTIEKFGYSVDTTPFDCLDHRKNGALFADTTSSGSKIDRDKSSSGIDIYPEEKSTLEVYISPYSLPCDVTAEVATASTVEELEKCRCENKILLLRGAICKEQLMPKNFPFYNPDEHQHIYSILEAKRPAAIITATEKNPDLVGALYPYPLINDGDFDIPNVYCTELVGSKIAKQSGKKCRLKIDAERIPAIGSNVIARKNPGAAKKIVITAHIDAYENAPGATDNASGTVVLLLLGELLSKYIEQSGPEEPGPEGVNPDQSAHGHSGPGQTGEGELGIELVAINGEDHYSAAGEIDYLNRYGHEMDKTLLNINIDDAGYIKGDTAFSFYECDDAIRDKATAAFDRYNGFVEGESWFNGDHMVFVQKGVPAVALASEYMSELMRNVTHTSRDSTDLVDCGKLVELAQALSSFIVHLPR